MDHKSAHRNPTEPNQLLDLNMPPFSTDDDDANSRTNHDASTGLASSSSSSSGQDIVTDEMKTLLHLSDTSTPAGFNTARIVRNRNSSCQLLKSLRPPPHHLPTFYSTHSRSVRFESIVTEHDVLNLEDYTHDEVKATWYTAKELHGIAVAVMRRMKQSRMSKPHIDMRGLEDHTIRERRDQQQYNRMAATYVVLQEQYKDWNVGDINNAFGRHQYVQQRQERISHAYQYVVQRCHCIEYALEIAAIDNYDANLIYDDWKQLSVKQDNGKNCFEALSFLYKIFQ